MNRPAARQSLVTTVALVGPDGSGKTTIARRLEEELGVPTSYVYMGFNPDASARQLPTTRLIWALRRRRGQVPDNGPPRPPEDHRAGGAGARLRREVRAFLRVGNLIAEEVYRTAAVRREVRRGRLVVFDRHYYFDYHAYDVVDRPGRGAARRIHGWFLRRVLPKPDLVVSLDAPAAVFLGRKGEGTVDDLRRRQADYERAFEGLRVVRVDATQPLDDVVADVRAAVLGAVRPRP